MTTKIYTRTGDKGQTGLWGGVRVPKSHFRVQAVGALDEANASLGLAIALLQESPTKERLRQLQPDLFCLGSHMAASTAPGRPAPSLPKLPVERVPEMEQWIDEMEGELPPLSKFIMPGGSVPGAALHAARTAVRRAERTVIAFQHEEPVEPAIVHHLNRLSDFLFVAARLVNHQAGAPEVQWLPEMVSHAP